MAFYETVIVFLQASTPTALLGRTLSDVYLFRGGSRAIGALVLGALLTVLAPGVLGVVLAVAFVSVALGVPAALPKLRRLAF